MSKYARGESRAVFTDGNPVIDELLKDKVVRDGLKEVFDQLTECLTNIFVKVAKKKGLSAEELLQKEPLVTYTLTLQKLTKEDMIKDLLNELIELKCYKED